MLINFAVKNLKFYKNPEILPKFCYSSFFLYSSDFRKNLQIFSKISKFSNNLYILPIFSIISKKSDFFFKSSYLSCILEYSSYSSKIFKFLEFFKFNILIRFFIILEIILQLPLLHIFSLVILLEQTRISKHQKLQTIMPTTINVIFISLEMCFALSHSLLIPVQK
jgi:hypothetical protein